MSGPGYLRAIKQELSAGRHQHRMGENLLAAFGYIRRRQSAIDEINRALDELGLIADPPVDSAMPLQTPRIRFSLAGAGETGVQPSNQEESHVPNDEPAADVEALVPAFRIAELEAADKTVACIRPDAPLAEAYTRMALSKYSQLVVAGSDRPRAGDIKGIISYPSIAKALLNGQPTFVRDCIDDSVPVVRSQSDLKDVLPRLAESDVVLIVGPDQRLQGIVTAWDLADEFAQLVDPFKRIGEIEARLRSLLFTRLGGMRVREFMADHRALESPQAEHGESADGDDLTMGDLQRILEDPTEWECLRIAGIDRVQFVTALDTVRLFRNRLMHFRDPLDGLELVQLANFCELVRQIPL